MSRVSRGSWTAAAAVLVALVAVALAGPAVAEAAAPAKPAKAGARKGIVQSVSPKAIVLRELDGSAVRVPVGPSTRIFVDGKRATLAAVKTGYTVVIPAKSSKGDKPARELRFLRPR
jgi:hypothetical protein